MADMLVKLYALPDLDEALKRVSGVTVRRPNPREKTVLLEWVRTHFTTAWAAECEAAFAVNPPACFVAIERGVIGFACHDCTRRNFFGPTGVLSEQRGRGVGRALLLACLHAMRARGYAYAIIGGVGPAEYYARVVGAVPIEGSTPGIYDFGLIG